MNGNVFYGGIPVFHEHITEFLIYSVPCIGFQYFIDALILFGNILRNLFGINTAIAWFENFTVHSSQASIRSDVGSVAPSDEWKYIL